MVGITNFIGFILTGLIIWWFWFSRPKTKSVSARQVIEILVADGVYTPARIEVPVGQSITLRFNRMDPSPCAEKVLFDDLKVSADLSVGEPMDLVLTLPKKGEYPFTCQMRMYRGALIAV